MAGPRRRNGQLPELLAAVAVGQGRGQHPQHPGQPGLLHCPEGVLGARAERKRVAPLEHDVLAGDVWSAGGVAVATAVLAAALAIFGYDWVHRVFRFLLIISFPCYAIISIAILVGHAGGVQPHHPGGFLFTAFMAQFSVAAAYNITYAPYVSDYLFRREAARWAAVHEHLSPRPE
jgi:hypothetical protein